MPPLHALYWLWIVWYSTWLLSLFWSGRSSARPDWREHGPYQFATMAGILLLFFFPTRWEAPVRLWTSDTRTGWILFALTAFCFLFCWWARITMGRLWNGFVGRVESHRIIDTGPFAIVRHPIYSGIILAAFLLAIEVGTIPAFIGAFLFLVAFWLKARLEERFLREQLGADNYDSYRRRVPMLIPFGPKSA